MAQTAAQKAAAAKAALAKLKAAEAKADAARKAAAKEKAYIDSFSNPITSQYDTRILQGGRVNTAGDVVKLNPEMLGKMTSSGTSPSKSQIPTSPGKAWIWDGKNWVKPSIPKDGRNYKWDDTDGWVFDGSFTTSSVSTAQIDSIAAISALLSSYGIGDLSGAITTAVQKGYSSDTIQLIMQDPNSNDPLAVAFQARFPANKARLKAGKSVLSAAEYLRAERSYTEILKSYGVSSFATPERLSQFISNDISATEVSDRVGLAVNRVQNADPETKKMLATYYPMLNQSDIIGAVLDPAEGLPALQRKVQISEIGGAALAQGLTTGMKAASNLQTGFSNVAGMAMGAEELANLGVTKEQARQGFQQVAEVAPRGEFLSSISGGEDYGRLQAEQEAFQGLASAKRARVSLTQQEQARFSGSSGTSKASLTSQRSGSF